MSKGRHTALALGLVVVTIFAGHSAARGADQRYRLMSPEEAGDLVKKVIVQVPDPPGIGASWELPEMTPDARGVRVGDSDFVVFAPSKASIVSWTTPLNLPELVLGIHDFLAPDDKGEKYVFTRTSGIIVSTVDLEVTNKMLENNSGRWREAVRLLPKGGYRCQLMELGVFIERPGATG